jgi:hypothetical protein
MHPLIGFFWAFDVHGNYKIVLWPHKYRQIICKFDPRVAQDWVGWSLDNNIDLMWHALNVEHLVRSGSNHAHDELRVTTIHCVLSIGRHFDQLFAPPAVRCVKKIWWPCWTCFWWCGTRTWGRWLGGGSWGHNSSKRTCVDQRKTIHGACCCR